MSWPLYAFSFFAAVLFVAIGYSAIRGRQNEKRLQLLNAQVVEMKARHAANAVARDEELQDRREAFERYQAAYDAARAKLDELKARATTVSEQKRVLQAMTTLGEIMRSANEVSPESYDRMAEEIAELTRKSDWLVPRR